MTNNADLGGTANSTNINHTNSKAGTAIVWLDMGADHCVKEEITNWLLGKDDISSIRFSPIISDLLNIGFKYNPEGFPALVADLERDFPDARIIGI